jgi:hypothetical protein
MTMKPIPSEVVEVKCKGKETSITLLVNREFWVGFSRHGSVGEDAEYEITDSSVISHERTETEYLHPERMKEGWTGGDAERGRWFFRVNAPGTTSLIIRTLFRFDVESECRINITAK